MTDRRAFLRRSGAMLATAFARAGTPLRLGSGAFAAVATAHPASAASGLGGEATAATLRALYPDRTPEPGDVRLEVPSLVENGNSVAVTVGVDPERFAAAGGPVELVLVVPRNPEAFGARFRVQAPGLPSVETRLRLAGTQNVTAAAAWPDGRLEVNHRSVLVTLGACIDENYEDFL